MTYQLGRTMKSLTLVLALSLSALFTLGCDDAADPSTDGPAARTLTAAVCEKQAACWPGDTETVSECETSLELVVGLLFTLEGIDVSESALDACVARYAAMDCETVAAYGGKPPVLTLCADVFTGTLPTGSACGGGDFASALMGDYQCASDVCKDGTCVALAGDGEACEIGGCTEGLTCFQGTCTPALKLNDDCSANSLLCVAPLDCFSSDGGTTFLCQQPTALSVGEECASGTSCEFGCFCPVGSEGCAAGLCGNVSRCAQ